MAASPSSDKRQSHRNPVATPNKATNPQRTNHGTTWDRAPLSLGSMSSRLTALGRLGQMPRARNHPCVPVIVRSCTAARSAQLRSTSGSHAQAWTEPRAAPVRRRRRDDCFRFVAPIRRQSGMRVLSLELDDGSRPTPLHAVTKMS